jgi:hypothetical protein
MRRFLSNEDGCNFASLYHEILRFAQDDKRGSNRPGVLREDDNLSSE